MKNVIVQDVSFTYENTNNPIIENLTVDVNSGDFLCILGQSGCGKSTFLRLLAGLEQPSSGTIKVNGEPINGASLDRGVVFQDYGLFPWMTAGENIMLPLKSKYPKKSKSELKSITLDMLKRVGLEEKVYEKYPKELSGGMKQRCAIASALSLNPPILLMDEPFGALDAVTRAKLQDLVLELWSQDEEKKTVFFVTHDVDEALLLGNKIIVLGQKPSHIIYECSISKEDRPTRDSLFENEKIMELRTDLIRQINKDVEEHREKN